MPGMEEATGTTEADALPDGEGEGILDMYEIELREVPEHLVLTDRRHVTPEELTDWIRTAWDRLSAVADAHGGPYGHPYVVYHGQVDEDGDGPVEMCLPIDPARASEVPAPTRTEPAHTQACTRITRAQAEYPQIISAYDALYRWARTHHRTPSAAPREIYFTPWPPASTPTAPAVDIALPLAR